MQKKEKKKKKKQRVQITKILFAQVSLAEPFNDKGLTVAPNKYTVPITDDSVICPLEMELKLLINMSASPLTERADK